MSWSIAEVARMSKVTSRTLRHYDEIGLLTPAYVGSNGYRYYEREQLLRLQRVLLLRELGLGLEAIADVLAGDVDQVTALRQHARCLKAEQARLSLQAGTVARTLRLLTEGTTMTANDMFEGFADRQAQLEVDLVDRYGEGVREHFHTSQAVTSDWSQADYVDAQQRSQQVEDRIVAVMRGGAAPDSETAQQVMAEHYAMVAQFWTPNRDSYTGLGQLYVDDPAFKNRYDAVQPGLAEYLRDATAAYADQHLE